MRLRLNVLKASRELRDVVNSLTPGEKVMVRMVFRALRELEHTLFALAAIPLIVGFAVALIMPLAGFMLMLLGALGWLVAVIFYERKERALTKEVDGK